VSFTYTVANNAVLGGHTIKVSYLQNSTYDPADGTATLTIRTPTSITPVNISANKGATVTLTVRITDVNSTAVPEGTVSIIVGNGEGVSANVGLNGEASISYNVPSNASGTINFNAVYIENNNYESSSTVTAGVLTIRKGTVVIVDSIKAELGDTITLSSTVTDEDSGLVDTGTVTYEIE